MSARPTTHAPRPIVALSIAALVALAGCSSSDAEQATSTTGASSTAAESVTVEDPWVKTADSGMSAAFGDITSSGSQDVTVVSVTTPASTMLELHETVENESGSMVMREKEGGFTIPAGGDLLLEPGGNHIMLMDLVEPLTAGQDIPFTLTFSDGSTLDFTAPAKDYSGANETYEGGDDESAHGDMDHGDMEHGDMGDMTGTDDSGSSTGTGTDSGTGDE